MKKENLEHIFKRELQDFEAAPPAHLWDKISEEITPKENRKKIFPFWYVSSGIAASLLLFYVFIFNSSNVDNITNIVTTGTIEFCPEDALVDTINSSEISRKEKVFKENSVTTLTEPKKESTKNNATWKKKRSTTRTSKSKYVIHRDNKSKNTAVSSSDSNTSQPQESIEKLTSNNIHSKKDLNDINQLSQIEKPISNDVTSSKKGLNEPKQLSDAELASLLLEDKDIEEPKKESVKKWGIQPQVGSYGYTSLTGGSTINSDFNDNPQFTETDLSYGIRIAYQASPKIKIRTGITNTNINITTSLIGVESSQDSQAVSEFFSENNDEFINLNDFEEDRTNEELIPIVEEEVINVFNPNSGEEVSEPATPNEEETPSESTTAGNISQRLQYIEFPVELTYNIIDKKIGIDIIGGFSTFILSNNQTTFESLTNSRTSLGETTSINNTSFSSNVGFSVDYNIVKNFSINIEPMIKFQFNSFDNSTDYQPILVGLSSGVIWKF